MTSRDWGQKSALLAPAAFGLVPRDCVAPV
jgi:hypothetical protein